MGELPHIVLGELQSERGRVTKKTEGKEGEGGKEEDGRGGVRTVYILSEGSRHKYHVI